MKKIIVGITLLASTTCFANDGIELKTNLLVDKLVERGVMSLVEAVSESERTACPNTVEIQKNDNGDMVILFDDSLYGNPRTPNLSHFRLSQDFNRDDINKGDISADIWQGKFSSHGFMEASRVEVSYSSDQDSFTGYYKDEDIWGPFFGIRRLFKKFSEYKMKFSSINNEDILLDFQLHTNRLNTPEDIHYKCLYR